MKFEAPQVDCPALVSNGKGEGSLRSSIANTKSPTHGSSLARMYDRCSSAAVVGVVSGERGLGGGFNVGGMTLSSLVNMSEGGIYENSVA